MTLSYPGKFVYPNCTTSFLTKPLVYSRPKVIKLNFYCLFYIKEHIVCLFQVLITLYNGNFIKYKVDLTVIKRHNKNKTNIDFGRDRTGDLDGPL